VTELVPSERAVLGQISALFLEASVRTYRLKALTSRWPVLHYDAYNGGYVGLVQKGFIAKSTDGLSFSITNSGLRAMGAIAKERR
jgi:hypothetical protein